MLIKKVILDTDLGGDCDDASAIAILNTFKNQGIVEVPCMLYSNSNELGARFTGVINDYYGNADIPVGVLKKESLILEYRGDKNFLIKSKELFANEVNKVILHNANELLYKTLSGAKDDEITIVCIGQLRNISVFLRSDFNGISGTDIFNKKVKELVIMGGNFEQTSDYFIYERENLKLSAEYNFLTDPNSVQDVLNNVHKKIIFVDFNIGVNIMTFGHYSTNYDKSNPVAVAYKLFENGPRESWDPLTVIYAVFGENEYFGLKHGVVTAEKHGRTYFNEQVGGKHAVVYLKQSKEKVEKYVESFLKEEL